MQEIERHEVGRREVERALEDIWGRTFAHWHSLRHDTPGSPSTGRAWAPIRPPRTLLPIGVLAPAALAVQAHGRKLDVRSAYLPLDLLGAPDALRMADSST